MFYIYMHIRLDTNTPFYIGKGSGVRAYEKRSRNKYWNSIQKLHGYKVKILLHGLTEEFAFKKEKELIEFFRNFKMCEANLTNGGEGTSGYVYTEEQLKRKSERMKGKNNPMFGKPLSAEDRKKKGSPKELNPMYGKTHSKEARNKISLKKSIPVECVTLETCFRSSLEAANFCNIASRSVYYSIKFKKPVKGLLFIKC